MASGRPRRPDDPSLLASADAASTVARATIGGRAWPWRFDLALITALPLAALGVGVALRLDWLIALAISWLAVFGAAMAWAPSRQRLIARSWCAGPPGRAGTGGPDAWIATRDGRLPAVLYTVPTDLGERVWLWCRAVLTAGDLEAALDILRAACWASEVRVVVNDRRSHIVLLEAIRRLPAERHGPGPGRVTPG